MSHLKYRPDIDGLRALAVLSVVIFHAFPSVMSGGFIGVDIFFVISGFLITTIIIEGLEDDRFRFGDFYARRVRRIFPTLLVVLAACLLSGWFMLLADEYQQLGKHVAAGSGFISNFVLMQEAGYFDTAAETKPLLHLWSLGVEEQFYIVWPLALYWARTRITRLLCVMSFVAVVSLWLNLHQVGGNPVAAFYSPLTRFWELAAGGLLACLHRHPSTRFISAQQYFDRLLVAARQKTQGDRPAIGTTDLMSGIGAAILLLGFVTIVKGDGYPGLWALIPVIGTSLIIAAGPNAWLNRTVLSTRTAVWFGLISFPLYLWHWPILTFARIFHGELPTMGVRLVLVTLSVLLAWLTFRLIESPLRYGGAGRRKTLWLIVLVSCAGAIGLAISVRDGLPSRGFNQKFLSYQTSIQVPERKSECFEIPHAYKASEGWFCSLGSPQAPVQYFAYGDSHALSLLPALDQHAHLAGVGIEFTGTSGCPSVLGIQSMRGEDGIEKYNCQALNERVFEHVRSNGIKHVILANRWTYYGNSLSRPAEFNPVVRDPGQGVTRESSAEDLAWAIRNTVIRYQQIGVQVIFIEDVPQQLHNPKDIIRKGGGG